MMIPQYKIVYGLIVIIIILLLIFNLDVFRYSFQVEEKHEGVNVNLFIAGRGIDDAGKGLVTDIFMFYADKNVGEDNRYMADGDWWAGLKLMKHLSNGEIRIHIITDMHKVLNEISVLSHPYYGYDLSKFRHINETFYSLYKHISVNTFTYEYLCFYRWLVFNEVVQLWSKYSIHPMRKIITMDLDVFMFKNPNTFFSNVLSACNMKLHGMYNIMLIPGGLTLWSPNGLNHFESFLINWYNRSIDDVMLSTKYHGDIIRGQPHFSDMYLLLRFVSLNVNNSRQLSHLGPVRVGTSLDECLLVSSNYHEITQNLTTVIKFLSFSRRIWIHLGSIHLPICFLHFQGSSKSKMKKFVSTNNYKFFY